MILEHVKAQEEISQELTLEICVGIDFVKNTCFRELKAFENL